MKHLPPLLDYIDLSKSRDSAFFFSTRKKCLL